MRRSFRFQILVFFILTISSFGLAQKSLETDSPAVVSTTLVISQVNGGGGGSTGTYLFDYVEIKNISSSPQSLNGLSLYYGSATGNFASTATNAFALPNVTLNPGQYYFVQTGPTGTAGAAFPVTPDVMTGNLTMSAASGKVALATGGLAINTCGATATPCSTTQLALIVDWVAYGAAGNGTAGNGEGGTAVNNGVAMTSTQGAVRKSGGCTETDNNNADFDVATAPVPRNTSSTATACGGGGGTGTGLTTTFTAYLSGAQEVPANTSTAKGFGRVTLNEAETSITVSVSYGSASAPLSSNVTVGHIHGPAAPGTNAGVLFDLAPTPGSPFGSVSNLTFNVTPAQVANLKAGLFYFNIHTSTFPGGEIRGQIQVPRSVLDTNADGRTDYVVARAAGGAGSQLTWFSSLNNGNPTSTRDWGVNGDQLIAGDYDGDGQDDLTVYRPTNGTFYIIQSATLTARIEQLGQSGDNPRIVGDYNGDGRDDPAVYRSGTQSVWYYRTAPNVLFTSAEWGQTGDFPAPGDYDGDGKSDFVVQRSTGGAGIFWKRLSGGTFSNEQFGAGTDGVVPGDYDGDGKTDVAVFRPTGGFYVWEFEPSGTAGSTIVSDTWGISGDLTVQGDYDGDGRTDYAVWRAGTPGTFYVMTVGFRNIFTKDWGQTGDIPIARYNTF